MRLWSLHPKYLDSKGLVALWREALLAQAVLQGKTRGYQHHPQLHRFRAHASPISAIAAYLWAVHREAEQRGYAFNLQKIAPQGSVAPTCIGVTDGQVAYEQQHLLLKLGRRDPERQKPLQCAHLPDVHPLFFVYAGSIESWERS